MRDAVYVTYTNTNGEEETVENRAASADRETLYDYFYDSCSAQRKATTLHDYSWEDHLGNTMQDPNGWKWVYTWDESDNLITKRMTIDECASHGMYLRQQKCADDEWLGRNKHLHEGTCPENRTW